MRPWPLSLSLYRELITDAIWAYQRDNYGYQNLRGSLLMVSFHGVPYAYVLVASIPSYRYVSGHPTRLRVNYYIDRLLSEPHPHDKVEFEIILLPATPSICRELGLLPKSRSGFSAEDLV